MRRELWPFGRKPERNQIGCAEPIGTPASDRLVLIVFASEAKATGGIGNKSRGEDKGRLPGRGKRDCPFAMRRESNAIPPVKVQCLFH